MTIQIIGAGFGRTGTDSLREALTVLGFGPCHHMREVNGSEEQKQMWRALAKGATPDWTKLLAGYKSCLDWPTAHYWRELVDFYSEAKVILTYRSTESWWRSFEQTILASIKTTSDRESLGVSLIGDQVFGGRPHDAAHAMAVYEANVAAVKASIPPERLLVHQLGDGFEPLCDFLGVDVPSQPYPKANTKEEFRGRVLGTSQEPGQS